MFSFFSARSKTNRVMNSDPTISNCFNSNDKNGICEEMHENAATDFVEGKDSVSSRDSINQSPSTESITHRLLYLAEKVEKKTVISKEIVQTIQKNAAIRSDEINKVKEDVKAFVKDWIDEIQSQEKKMLEDIETTEKSHQEQDMIQISTIEQHVEKMKSAMERARELTKDNKAVYDGFTEEDEVVRINEEILAVDLEIEAKPSRGYHQFIPNQNITVAIESGGVGSLLDCIAEGDGLKRGTVGLKSKFTITTLAIRGTSKQTHYDSDMYVEVKIHAGEEHIVPDIKDNKNGTYDVVFEPRQPVDHVVVITLNGQLTVESPYKVPVRECVVACDKIIKGTVGMENSFTVSFVNSSTKTVYDPATKIEVHFQAPQESNEPFIHNNEDGTYKISFVPSEAGQNQLIITVDGQELPMNPYTVNVRKCIVTGDGTKTGKVALKSHFSVAFCGRDGNVVYDPSTRLNVRIQHSQGSEVTSDIKDQMNGTYSVSFYPEQPGSHSCIVSLQMKTLEQSSLQKCESLQQEIPESPFTVTVKPREFQPVLKFGRKGTNNAELNWPSGVAVTTKDEIIVADCGNHRLQVFNKEGDYLTTIGKKGPGAGQFIKPSGIVINKENNMIVLDKGNGRVQILNEKGEYLSSFASRGKDNGQLENPQGISLDTNGNIVVTDTGNYRIQVFSNEGKWLLSFDCQNARDCIACGGYYFVSTASENCVKVFDKSGAFICKYGARGTSQGAFDWPTGLAVDKAGHLVVCDTSNSRVQVLNLDGTFIGSFGGRGEGQSQFDYPACIAAMSDGQLVVCDARSNTVHIFK